MPKSHSMDRPEYAKMLACEEPVTLERLMAADDLLLSSSIRGLHPAALAGRAAHAREPLPS